MKAIYTLLAVLVVLGAAPCCAQNVATSSSDSGANSSSIEARDGNVVATIRGSAGISTVQGDKVELTHRTVYVNGRSFGAVPKVCEIKYIVTKTSRTLLVDGKPRGPVANSGA